MASKQSVVDYIIEQMAGAGQISAKKMFGEYGVYCDKKVVGFICDDRLFVKPTEAGEQYIGKPKLKPFYPGGKPYFLIGQEKIEDADWLAGLIKISLPEMSSPKKTTPKKTAKKKVVTKKAAPKKTAPKKKSTPKKKPKKASKA